MIEGYAAVFWDGTPETEYVLGESRGVTYVERIGRGAFDEALRRDDVRAYYNHNPHLGILGRSSAGTLQLKVDDRGLHYRVTSGTTRLHQDVLESQQRGDLRGSSFGFSDPDEAEEFTRNKVVTTIRSLRLHDVGPVAEPAYSATEQDGRSIRCITSGGVVLPVSRYECRARIQSVAVKLRLKEIGNGRR